MYATLVLVVELAQAYCHLATTRTWGCDNDQRTLCLYVIVLAEALVRSDKTYVVRIAFDKIMVISLDAFALQTLTEGSGSRLSIVMSDDNRAYHKATVLELATQTQHVFVVSNAEVGALLVLLDVRGTDHHYNLNAVAKLLEHAQLAVGCKSRQYSTCVMVVEELASKFKIQFAIEL